MKDINAIEVHNLKKMFKVYYDKGNQLKERILFWKRNKYEERWVLNGIDFEVKKGEAVALIGHNGCGKSTTLKLLTKIIYPDYGTIEMKGRVSSLIELGAGFHPDMSGRENIYINAAIFGLTKKEIDERVDDIIRFSELEEYIDNPVRTYSSGMYMRLAFSVAINVDADILLIDEILAVGDAGFQTKCFNKMKEIKATGTTIVLVSHSMGQVEQICDRSIWIHEGKIMKEGKPRDVDPEYLDYMGEQRQKIAEREEEEKQEEKKQEEQKQGEKRAEEKKIGEKKAEEKKKLRWGNGFARITGVHMNRESKRDAVSFKTGEKVEIVLEYEVNKIVEDAVFGIGIFRVDGLQCYGTNTRIEQLEKFDLKTNGMVKITINDFELLPGNYTLDVAIECEVGIPVDYYKEAYRFEMQSTIGDVGVTRLNHNWNLDICE